MVDIVLSVPYYLESSAGNSVTALRLRRQLVDAGLSVVIVTPRDRLVPARCLIALNAWRSSEVVASFEGPSAILLTGTDINDARTNDLSWEGRIAMERAQCLVVLQPAVLEKVPSSLKEKCQVIFPSVELPDGLVYRGNQEPTAKIILAARDRPEKRADLVLEACRILPENAPVQVEWFGAIGQGVAPKFQWMGPLSQEDLWQKMSQADWLLNASSEEGGANAVCEAISLGLPVLASRIPGNVGLLGPDYPGYFESGNAGDLVSLIQDPPREACLEAIAERGKFFSPQIEAKAWVQLVECLLK